MAPEGDILVLLFFLRLAVIIIDVILGIVMLQKTRKVEMKITKKYLAGATAFFFVHAICRTFYLFHIFFYPNVVFFYYGGTFLGLLSVVIVVASIESTIYTKSKHLITIWGCICLSIMVAGMIIVWEYAGITLMIWGQYLALPILVVFIISIYFNVARKSTGNVRKNSIIMTIAIILFGTAEMGNTNTAVVYVGEWVSIVAPMIAVAALILLYISVSNFYRDI